MERDHEKGTAETERTLDANSYLNSISSSISSSERHGSDHDRLDMERMGKKQEMNVSCSSLKYILKRTRRITCELLIDILLFY